MDLYNKDLLEINVNVDVLQTFS